MSIPTKIFLSIFFLIFCTAGIFMLWNGINLLQQSMATKNWDKTTGILEKVRLDREIRSRKGYLHKVNVEYRYRVNGLSYVGESLSYGYTASNDYEGHNRIFQKLKSVKQIEVRFNPINPSKSTLSYEVNTASLFMIGFGTSILVFITFFAAVFYSSEQHHAGLLNRLVILNN